jgi:ferredoxin
MISLTIDNQKVQVPAGTTVLEAARSAGIHIPSLCYALGFKPATSCMVCVVRVEGVKTLVPACGLHVSDRMNVTTQSDEIQQARTAAIELLLSDHAGDCVGPCEIGCPAKMDIPAMLRQIAAGDLTGAIRTIKNDIPLPAILGRICPAPCEKVCRRAGADGAVSICLLKRFAADADINSSSPYQPACKPLTGQKAAIIGAGPAGLSAAYYLRQGGIACDLFDQNPRPGGALRYAELDRTVLPVSVVERETEILLAAGITFFGNVRLGRDMTLDELKTKYDAVVLATGAETSQAGGWGIVVKDGKIQIDRQNYSVMGHVYAAGGCIGSRNLCVRAVADGKEAAEAILQKLRGLDKTPPKPYNHRLGRLEKQELELFIKRSSPLPRISPERPEAGFSNPDAVSQALRCLNCDCGKKEHCGLRDLATEFEVRSQSRQSDTPLTDIVHDSGMLVYDSGKCVKCGLCVQMARREGEKIGLAFQGRGFGMKIAVPLGKSLAEGLTLPAQKYVSVCPTGALTLKKQ